MKKLSIKAFMVTALSALALTACVDESGLYEKIDPDALRTTTVFQLKNLGSKTCTYQVELEAVVMAADNFEAGCYAIQDGDEAQDGIVLKSSGNFSFGEKVSINLDGVVLSKEGDIYVMTDPDGTRVKSVATAQAYAPVAINLATVLAGTYQSMYVSLEGWQVIEEDLEKTYADGVSIESKDKDTISVVAFSKASFANQKVAQGSGKISGVVAQNSEGEWVILPQSADDVEFSDERFKTKEPNNAAIVWSEGASLTKFVSEVSTNEIEGATALKGSGNCFVVSEAGTYCFDAKNSADVYPDGIPADTKIYFKVASTGGNAVVCYVDDSKNILWTWHIWCSPKSLSEMSVERGTLTVLDRLVGAVNVTPGDPASNGLYYQWGRKDAFVGPNTKGDLADDKEAQSEEAIGGVATAVTTINYDLGVADWCADASVATTAQQAAAIPTTMQTTSTWADTPGGATGEEWPAEGNPCPAGWRVPTADEAKVILGVETKTDFTGMDQTNLCTTYEGMFFPNNGDRARKNGRLLSLGRRYFSWLNTTSGNSGCAMMISKSLMQPDYTFNRGNATGVRCVKGEAVSANLATVVWSEGESLTGYVSEVSTKEISGATALDGSANCFVVSTPGTYCFDAKTSAGEYPEGVAEGTKIYFKVAKVGGNAVVGIVDNTDDNNLQWTWHIWCSEKSVAEMSVARGTLTVMDRVLGANNITAGDPASNGLYYQWGRKDAFVGPNMKGDLADDKEAESEKEIGGDATAVTTVNTAVAVAWCYDSSVKAPTAKEAAAIPTTIQATSTWADTPGGEAGEAWPAEGNPCPAGWRVPTADDAKIVLGVEDKTEFTDMDQTNLCTTYEGMFFPNNGDRARKNGRLLSLGRRHFSWVSSTSGNSGYAIMLSKSLMQPNYTFNRGNATGVRCVK